LLLKVILKIEPFGSYGPIHQASGASSYPPSYGQPSYGQPSYGQPSQGYNAPAMSNLNVQEQPYNHVQPPSYSNTAYYPPAFPPQPTYQQQNIYQPYASAPELPKGSNF
jgi:hypothetical protein